MSRVLLASFALLLTLQGSDVRAIHGTVVDRRGNLLPTSVVEIENTATLDIQSYIVHEDGEFHFKNLSSDVDFSVHATYHGHISKTVIVSKFNESKDNKISLVIPVE
jgi:hypothetical protein